MLRFSLLFSLLLPAFAGSGQTPNNDMINAERLSINQFVYSETHGNTVQWECVDEELTGKCIDYHNDQWFYFENENFTSLYINLSGQRCRDLRGAQIVIIKGELCQPETYTILDCISLATQDDIHVKVDHLEPHQLYWLNVDGYLHDFCKFYLEVSEQPQGISLEKIPLEVKKETNQNIISLQWTLPDSLATSAYEWLIYQRDDKAFRFDSIATVPVKYFAFGNAQKEYMYRDTLVFPGTYNYRLALKLNTGRKLHIDDFSFDINETNAELMAALSLDYDPRTPLEILIKHPLTEEVLEKITITYNQKRHRNFRFYVNSFKQLGINQLLVDVVNQSNSHTTSYYVRLN